MKKHILKGTQILMILGVLFTTSCKKDDDTAEPSNTDDTEETNSAKEFLNELLENETETFTYQGNQSKTINAQNGTVINIPANCFKDASGNVVTGDIDVDVVEVLDKATMILTNKTTTSNGELLISGGEVYVKAMSGNDTLTLVDGQSVNVQLPTNNTSSSMIIFEGSENNQGDVNWDTTDVTSAAPVLTDSANTNYVFYNFEIENDSLGWINCDYFYKSSEIKTTVSVSTPEGHDNENTAVFFFFEDLYSVAPAYWSNDSEVFASYSNSLPIGQKIKVIAISEKDDTYYYGISSTTISADQSISLTMNPISESLLKTTLNAL